MNTYTMEQIFKHMTPATLAAWIGDFDSDPESLDVADLVLMQAAIYELFALVGDVNALGMLGNYGIDNGHFLVMAAITAYNE